MEGGKAIGYTTFLSIIILVIAFLYNKNINYSQAQNEQQARLSQILDAMLQIEDSNPVGKVKIAVGYGSCRDVFVSAADILRSENIPNEVVHHGYIQNIEELKETYALFFSSGSAAERYISNKTLFLNLVELAESSQSFYSYVGGNAPVMAKRFASEGATVLLAARHEEYLMAEMLSNIIVGGGKSNQQEDIHLILEYKKGESWGKYVAPRANRFIVHSDSQNPTLNSMTEFGQHLKSFQPNLMIVSGLQMMDNYPYSAGQQNKYLTKLKEQLLSLPPSAKIHFEMASFTEMNLLQAIKQNVIPYVDSLGMNEQELPTLYNLLRFNNLTVISDQNPRVAQVLDQMRGLFKLLENKKSSFDGGRPLTRIHVHTLAFQAIMVDTKGPWKNTRAAATKSALVAHRHVCSKDQVYVKNSHLLMDEGFSLSTHPNTGKIMFDDLKPVSCWMEDTRIQICIAPVLVCTKVRQTAGGGDNISAAGLVLQV